MAQPIHLERKTLISSAWMLLAGCGLSVANGIQGTPLFPELPGYVQSMILALGPTIVTALTGYVTKHTERADLAAVSAAPAPAVEAQPDPFA